MLRWSQLPRPLLLVLAAFFAAPLVLYAVLWMYAVRQPPGVELGFNNVHGTEFDAATHSYPVFDVVPASPAERAGLRAGDRIVAVNGQPLVTSAPFDETWDRGRPGDAVELTVQRPGESKPLVLHGVFRASQRGAAPEGLGKASAMQIKGLFPVPFLAVGLAVLFLRPADPKAWLLALVFATFVAAPSFPSAYYYAPALLAFAHFSRAVFDGMLCPLFYVFFAVFPARSPLDRRWPWLKWVSLLFGVLEVLPGLRSGNPQWPAALADFLGRRASLATHRSINYVLLALGLVSLAGNAFAPSIATEARRKSRVILWGTVAGVLPVVLERVAVDFWQFQPSFWLDTALTFVLFVFPLSFGYAVVKHRVLEIPVLLKRSARYVFVQRGFIVLLFGVAAGMIFFFTRAFSRFIPAGSNAGMAGSAVFGIVLVWVAAPLIRRGTNRIDRAFFRSAYDARMILQDLADKARTVNDRHQLAALLERHIKQALHPKFLAGYLEAGDARLAAEFGPVPPQLVSLDTAIPLLAELSRRGRSWEIPPPKLRAEIDLSGWAPLEPECLVPILGRENRLIGLLVLGERLSEEPYSSEDARLLDSVASQAGVALESIRLAERIAERMEVERRAALEVEIAREVQSKLFPQKMPPLATLEYAGGCVQARVVGGDYYDFLDLGPGRLAIILADISGKGIAGALLMANLQANVRSQYALALDNLPLLLQSVNRLFCENIPEDRFATLFFADYEDAGRRLRYVNCGHNYPLLLRADGSLERLASTATVLGMFRDWDCQVVETVLHPGDILVMYTDGVTEAPNAEGEEFGEKRLLESMRAQKHRSAADLLAGVTAAVQQFSSGAQADDLTLVVARAR
ncbi:MAG TPA: SpoIIE family protein phosphatase [Candidatus Acidoferrales bacterium]|nr:SpoIIE family protein phosphatase [Candidatus Acidoferrales bacterium]